MLHPSLSAILFLSIGPHTLCSNKPLNKLNFVENLQFKEQLGDFCLTVIIMLDIIQTFIVFQAFLKGYKNIISQLKETFYDVMHESFTISTYFYIHCYLIIISKSFLIIVLIISLFISSCSPGRINNNH